MLEVGLTDHLEGPRDRASAEIFAEVADLVRLADELGVKYAWFAEHHAHAHQGHLPTPLLLALHLAGQTERIQLGTAVICLNLHHALDVAEQVATADLLSGGRLSPGFGSGSTPGECELFGSVEQDERERHARFEDALSIIRDAWAGRVATSAHQPLPIPAAGLIDRSWIAVNSTGAASVAGRLGFNVLLSHLRTIEEYQQYMRTYRAAGGRGRVAANRPVFVGRTDTDAIEQAEPALRILWHRFRAEGKITAGAIEPKSVERLCGHPINFIVGGPQSVAREIGRLHAECAFDVLNVELRWAGLSHEQVRGSLRRLMEEVLPRCAG